MSHAVFRAACRYFLRGSSPFWRRADRNGTGIGPAGATCGCLLDTSVRAQGYRGQFVVGASYARSNPYLSPRFAVGRQAFSGLDVRWAHPAGFQARGEFLNGHSYEGVSTPVWYVDGIVHRPGMGPFTAVIRSERTDYTAPSPRDRRSKRLTLGTRVRLPGPVTLQLNYLRQHGDLPRVKTHSSDVSATYSFRVDR